MRLGSQEAYVAGVSTRKGRPAGGVARLADLDERGLADLRRSGWAGGGPHLLRGVGERLL